jgi:uncharacterized RDD family membrane protein YckC
MESSERQATFGKLMMGICITDLEGNRIGFWQGVIRMVIKFSISGAFLIGFLMQIYTDRRQALHDLLASTVVVNK